MNSKNLTAKLADGTGTRGKILNESNKHAPQGGGLSSSRKSKFLLSMAVIAVLGSAAVAAEVELKVDGTELKLGTEKVVITNGTANVAPSETDKAGPVAIKSTISNSIGSDTLTNLNITASEAPVNIGETSQTTAVKLGGETPTSSAAGANGYGVNITAKSVALAGKSGQATELNVNTNGVITTGNSGTDDIKVDANSKINVAKGVTLTTTGAINNSGTIALNGGTLNSNGALTATTGSITLGGGTLTTTGLTGTAGTISLGSGGVLNVNGETKQTGTTISLDGGTANFNGAATLDGTKLTLTEGGTLNFNAASGASASSPTSSTISGAVSTTKDKAVNVNLSGNTKVSFSGDLTLTNNTASSLDKITLNGGTLAVSKLTAAATNLNTTGGGVIDFTGDGSAVTGDLTLGSGTTLKFSSSTNTNGTTFDTLTTNGGKLDFAQGTANVKNLTANASDLSFDATNGGKLVLQNGGKTSISGALAMENGEIVISAGATANELSLNSLSLTKTGKITLNGGTVNVSQGLNADDAKNQIVLTEGGTINFNGGTSSIAGTDTSNVFTTTAQKDTKFNVNSGTLNLTNAKLADANAILTLKNGVVNAAGLETTDAANLALNGGTLNFVGITNADGTTTSATSTIKDDWDLTKFGSAVNFNKGSVVKFTGTNSQLTASSLNLNGGEINLKKLTAAPGESNSGFVNLNFTNARASVAGDLSNTAEFSIGTDSDGNSFISKSGETAKLATANDALYLNSGSIHSLGTLETATSGGKLVFNGGNLVVGEAGTLKIADTNTQLEVARAGSLTLKGNADGTSGGSFTITSGDLDLSSGLNISLEKGANITTTKASKISGTGQSIQLGKYAALSINGEVTTATSGKFEAYKTGDLTLGKGTTLGISTAAVEGVYKELEMGKITATNGGNLRFGTGNVELTGEIDKSTSTALTLNNQGFVSDVQLADGAVLNFNSGVVSVKGKLDAKTAGTAGTPQLKVSGATADLQGGLGTNLTQIELSGGGALNIKGDYTAPASTSITTDGKSKVNVAGAVSSANNLTFSMLDVGSGSYTVLSSTKGVTGEAKAELKTRTSLQSILDKYGLTLGDANTQADDIVKKENREKVQDVVIANSTTNSDKFSVATSGNDIVVSVASLEKAADTSSLQSYKSSKDTEGMATAKAVLDTLKSQTSFVENQKTDDFAKVITALETKQTEAQTTATNTSNAQAASEIIANAKREAVDADILLSAFGETNGRGAKDDTIGTALLNDIETGGRLISDIKDAVVTAQNTASPTASVTTTMNLSNDMSIGGRIAAARNPYGNYASIEKLAGLRFAAVKNSDAFPAYYSNNDYMNGFWGNVFGGLNKIEGESGALFGVSLGFDRQLESALLGFYLSYAKANLNDKLVEQGSDNIQAGVYVSFNQRDIELNAKIYGQTAVTNQDSQRGSADEIASANFVRQFAGITANIGKIFAFNNNTSFIKPFIGENYYYTYTPAYKESGSFAVETRTLNNHALSFDVGVDYRQYLGENSFIYLTPKIERYVVNTSNDFTAGFVGSDTTFSIAGKSSTKTYAQVLLGGNIDVSKKLNVNLGLGFRKIITGQVERQNGDKVDEMYLNGNLGVKYRF